VQPTVLVASSIASVEMNEDVRQLAADSGVLRHVTGRPFEAGYEVVELEFEHGALRLTCNGDTDEIVVAAYEHAVGFDEIVNDDSLADLLGKVIEQAWVMVNERGYTDAFQLRCIDLATRSETCRQFEVAASAITVAHVSI
jgi:Family of unknown function (DUF6334)